MPNDDLTDEYYWDLSEYIVYGGGILVLLVIVVLISLFVTGVI